MRRHGGCVMTFEETRRYQSEPQPPAYKCTTAACEERFHELDYMKLCEGCAYRFCDEHLVAVGENFSCKDCVKYLTEQMEAA